MDLERRVADYDAFRFLRSKKSRIAWLVVAFVFWEFPQWFSSVRALATDPGLSSYWPHLPHVSLAGITVNPETVIRSVGGLMFGVLALVVVRGAPSRQEPKPTQERKPEPPILTVTAYGGASVVMTIKNNRSAFMLGTRARIVRATEPVTFSAPFEYKPRKLGTGETLSGFTVAEINDDLVTIYGEFMNAIQYWRVSYGSRFEAVILFTFLKVDGGHSEIISEQTMTLQTMRPRSDNPLSRGSTHYLEVTITP